ncbi:envelope glycoprotein C [Saimiriine alphaherpesvirus 1]|uniref:Envelope glycoprotein C n=1 Tax=Saimiriine herpesvirus 1 (strain MV-5-4-PSL) TaxID=10353 RepID=E2IUC6_SHV1|nr:envelope glycoprotein C [Saimiriine alphaherpesvirus 1]ADO13784.1 envelope glycoprotein C [Saimiriine alphaherpesvirus 1]
MRWSIVAIAMSLCLWIAQSHPAGVIGKRRGSLARRPSRTRVASSEVASVVSDDAVRGDSAAGNSSVAVAAPEAATPSVATETVDPERNDTEGDGSENISTVPVTPGVGHEDEPMVPTPSARVPDRGTPELDEKEEKPTPQSRPTPASPPTTPRKTSPISCDHEYMQTRMGTKMRMPCRIKTDNASDVSRVRVVVYALEEDHEAQYRRISETPGAIQSGAQLVYDSQPEAPSTDIVPWAKGAGPAETYPPLYSMSVHKGRWRLEIAAVEFENQGVYQWVYGEPAESGVAVLVTVFHPPRVSLRSDPIVEGDLPKAVCSAVDYFPGTNSTTFEWFEDGVAVPPGDERVSTRVVSDRPEAFSAISTFASADPSQVGVEREFTCQVVWRRDSVSFSRMRATSRASVLPRPHVQIRLFEDRVECDAACVPGNVTIAWTVDGVRAADTEAPENEGVCVAHPGTFRIRSTRSLTPGQCTYACGVVGYPLSVSALERHVTRDPCEAPDSMESVVYALQLAGLLSGVLSAAALCAMLIARCVMSRK